MKATNPCLMVAVDLDSSATGLIRRAARLARTTGLRLLIVHLVEYHSGFESDHAPFLSPAEMREAMAHTAHERLGHILKTLSLAEAGILVRTGRLRENLAELVLEQRARYLITGPLKWGFLSKLATLGSDWRLQECNCELMHLANEHHWTERLGRLSQLFGA